MRRFRQYSSEPSTVVTSDLHVTLQCLTQASVTRIRPRSESMPRPTFRSSRPRHLPWHRYSSSIKCVQNLSSSSNDGSSQHNAGSMTATLITDLWAKFGLDIRLRRLETLTLPVSLLTMWQTEGDLRLPGPVRTCVCLSRVPHGNAPQFMLRYDSVYSVVPRTVAQTFGSSPNAGSEMTLLSFKGLCCSLPAADIQ